MFGKSRRDPSPCSGRRDEETIGDGGATHLDVRGRVQRPRSRFASRAWATVGPLREAPVRPAVWLRVRRPAWDAELNGQWLTPSIGGSPIRTTRWFAGQSVAPYGSRGSGGAPGRVRAPKRSAQGRQARSARTFPPRARAASTIAWAVGQSRPLARRGFRPRISRRGARLYQERHERSDSCHHDRLPGRGGARAAGRGSIPRARGGWRAPAPCA